MTSEALHLLGRDIALACLGAIRTLETHGPENQALAQALDRVASLVGSALTANSGEAVRLDIVDARLLINGDRLRAFGTTQEAFDQLVAQFAERKLGGVAFTVSPTPATLRRWLSVFTHRPADDAGFAALHAELAALAETGISALEQRTILEFEHEEATQVSTMAFAMQTYARALLAFREFVRATKEGRDPYKNRLDVVKVVQDVIDVVSARSDLLFQIIHLASTRPIGRTYGELHGANTCIYAAMMGHVLRLDRTSLLDLSTAAMLSDVISSVRVDASADEAIEWTPEQRRTHRSDLAGAVRSMIASGELDEAMMIRAIVAEEYASQSEASVHPYSRITAVASAYDALTQRRPWREAKHPLEALMTLRAEGARKFDPQMVLVLECVLAGYLGIATSEQAEF